MDSEEIFQQEQAFLESMMEPIRARVAAGTLGGPEDGRERYIGPLNVYTPDNPNPIAGRCLIDGQAWDDHLDLLSQVGNLQCRGLKHIASAE